jgi:hypothetical protein
VYVGTGGSSGGDEGFVMDGALDAEAPVLATAGGATLWGKAAGGWLYLATDAPATLAGRDVFLLIRDGAGAPRTAPWAKAGQAAGWSRFLARESGNGWTGWFSGNETLLSGDPSLVTGSGAVLEGAVQLSSLFPVALPATIEVAMAAYATSDGGALQGQAPLGDGDGQLEAAEFASVPLYVTAVPAAGAGAGVRLAAWPTPFNAQVKLVLAGVADGPVAVTIHDARGRGVRRLTGDAVDGQAQFVWDGRDASGHILASGTYFARSEGSRAAVARLTMVK